MKNKNSIIIALIVVLILATSVVLFLNTNPHKSIDFDAAEAIAMVIKEHPEFPVNPSEIITKQIPIGGPYGSTLDVKFITTVEKIEEESYLITLAKEWGMKINGKYVESSWKYKVTPDEINLLESVDNDNLIKTIK